MKIVVLLANGFEEGEALFLTDVLRRANFDVELVSTTGDLMVEGSHHIRVQADTLLDDHILESDAFLVRTRELDPSCCSKVITFFIFCTPVSNIIDISFFI